MGDGAVAEVQSGDSGTARRSITKPKRTARKRKDAEFLDPDILWLVHHSAGEMGFRAAPIEPGVKAAHAHVPAHVLQVPAPVLAAAGRQRRVIAALGELSDDERGMVLATHTPLPPALHYAASLVDPLDPSGCGLAGACFWLCAPRWALIEGQRVDESLPFLVAAYGATGGKREGDWLERLGAAHKRVQGAREGRTGAKAGYLAEMALVIGIARKMVANALQRFQEALAVSRAEDWARMRQRREARDERFRDLVCAEELTRRVSIRSIGVS